MTGWKIPLRALPLLAAALLALPSAGRTRVRGWRLSRWGVAPGDYSGIAPLGGGRYAVVSDKERASGFRVWRVRLSPRDGRPLEVRDEGFRGVALPAARDQEGVAACPAGGRVLVSGEADQLVLEHRADGSLTGRGLQVPTGFGPGDIQPNRGFEALCHDTLTHLTYTATESPLPRDSALRLRLLRFGPDLRLLGETPYTLSPPRLRPGRRGHWHGLVALAALGDGRLLALEREASLTRLYMGSRCRHRLFLLDPVTGRKRQLARWGSRLTPLSARLANYEGMCLAPPLPDGRRVLLLLSDAQGGKGKALWRLRDRLAALPLPPL